MANRLQHKIACSRYAFPLTIVYACGIWLSGGLLRHQLWASFILMLVTTVVMAELNNQHALFRTYSRMLSCSYLALSVAALPLFVHPEACVVQLCFALTYLFMFRAYQDKSAVSNVFNAFFFIGLASVWFLQTLFLVPLWWIILRFYVMGMGWRTFWASLLAVITPYWFVGGYYVYMHDVDSLVHHFSSITNFAPLFDFQSISLLNLLTLCFISALGIIGMLHFLLNRSKDKIRIRLFFSSFMLMMAATIVFIILQPTHLPNLLPALIVSVSPLIGHYITFTGSRLSGITCLALFAFTLAITGYQLWTH